MRHPNSKKAISQGRYCALVLLTKEGNKKDTVRGGN